MLINLIHFGVRWCVSKRELQLVRVKHLAYKLFANLKQSSVQLRYSSCYNYFRPFEIGEVETLTQRGSEIISNKQVRTSVLQWC